MIHWLQKHLLKRRNKSGNHGARLISINGGARITDLSDDISINILSRLPLGCILNLQTVCKKWLTLTSTQYFAETHFKSGASSQISEKNELDLFFFDPEAERYKLVKILPNGLVRVTDGGLSPRLVGSCNGLLVFQMFLGSRFLVWDLVARQHAYVDAPTNGLTVPSPCHNLLLSAIIFHPSEGGGYKLLFSSRIGNPDPGYQYVFLVYESGNNTWRKLSTTSFYPPTKSTDQPVVNPTVYKRCLFWMAPCHEQGIVDNPHCRSSVVIFDMDAEEFRSMPHPGRECKPAKYAHKHMYIFEEKGQLYFCHNCFETLAIWSLEGYDRWYWVKKDEFRLDYVLLRIPFMSGFLSSPINFGFDIVKVMKMEGDAIYFHCRYRGLFMYDWRKKKLKRLDKTRSCGSGYSGTVRIWKSANLTYSESWLSLESGFRCRKRQGRIHGAVM